MDYDDKTRKYTGPGNRRKTNNLTGGDTGGVYYTPSNTAKSKSPNVNRQSGRGSQSVQKPQSRPASSVQRQSGTAANRSGRNNYVMFYLLTLVAAVAVCLVVFFVVFNRVTNDKPDTGSQANASNVTPGASQSKPPVSAAQETSIIGMIRSVDPSAKELGILDIESLKVYTFSVDGATSMQNKYGEAMSITEFHEGDIVDARYAELEGVLSSLTISPRAWEHRNVTNLRVDPDNSTVSLGNDTFAYDPEMTVVTFNGEPHDIAEIEPLNVVTLKGMGDTAWFIEINKGIGTIDIVNGEDIKDGFIEIDNNITVALNEKGVPDEVIKVQTGSRRVVVKGSNIEPYVTTVDVDAGQHVTVDLSQAQVTAGVLNIILNETDAAVTINGNTVTASEPQILTYGEYTVTAEKNGFISFEHKFEMNQPTMDLQINLEEEIATRKITIITTPSGADVYIDNAYIGISPVTTSVEEIVRTITVKKAGYIDVSVNIDEHSTYEIGMGQITQQPSDIPFATPSQTPFQYPAQPTPTPAPTQTPNNNEYPIIEDTQSPVPTVNSTGFPQMLP